MARSVDFAGRQVALLGSDAGFTDDDRVTRRWELKFLWFNPMWALLTIAGAVLLVVGVRRIALAWVGIALFGTMAVIVFASETFVYAPDDESLQRIGTASNTAFWAALALAGGPLRPSHPRLLTATRAGAGLVTRTGTCSPERRSAVGAGEARR